MGGGEEKEAPFRGEGDHWHLVEKHTDGGPVALWAAGEGVEGGEGPAGEQGGQLRAGHLGGGGGVRRGQEGEEEGVRSS